MRRFLHIDLNDRSIKTDELHGEDIVRAGRYLIAKTLVEAHGGRITLENLPEGGLQATIVLPLKTACKL